MTENFVFEVYVDGELIGFASTQDAHERHRLVEEKSPHVFTDGYYNSNHRVEFKMVKKGKG